MCMKKKSQSDQLINIQAFPQDSSEKNQAPEKVFQINCAPWH